jgi:hypothetical protein
MEGVAVDGRLSNTGGGTRRTVARTTANRIGVFVISFSWTSSTDPAGPLDRTCSVIAVFRSTGSRRYPAKWSVEPAHNERSRTRTAPSANRAVKGVDGARRTPLGSPRRYRSTVMEPDSSTNSAARPHPTNSRVAPPSPSRHAQNALPGLSDKRGRITRRRPSDTAGSPALPNVDRSGSVGEASRQACEERRYGALWGPTRGSLRWAPLLRERRVGRSGSHRR